MTNAFFDHPILNSPYDYPSRHWEVEFGITTRPYLQLAAHEASNADFDVIIACAFSYDAHTSKFDKLGRIPLLKARMNADLQMADDIKNTGVVIFGEPDFNILETEGGQVRVKVNGVDVFHPHTGEVHSDGAGGIACWFIDTDYNEEAWESLNSETSRPFGKPKSGRIAVTVINHLGDEVMKVFRVGRHVN